MDSPVRNLGVFAAYAERRYVKEASKQLLELFWREHERTLN